MQHTNKKKRNFPDVLMEETSEKYAPSNVEQKKQL